MSPSSEAEESAPFTVLAEWLVVAAQDEGPISLPGETLVLFNSPHIHDDSGIRRLFELYGTSDHTNRLRLDHGAFMNTVAVLLHLPYSPNQERLLYAFMATIELMKDIEATRAALKRVGTVPYTVEEINTKRRKINNKLIKKMMLVLIRDDQEAAMRLMAAHILFALIHNSVEAQEVARKQPEIVELGPLIDDDSDYILRLFTANIVRELCSGTSQPHRFWPQTPRQDKHRDFPLAPASNSGWVRAMANYLSSKNVQQAFTGDSRPSVSRLFSVSTERHTFEDKEASILAVITDRFIFAIPSTAATPMETLELLLDGRCTCEVNETTSPDFRDGSGDEAVVEIISERRGDQLYRGAKSALERTTLILPSYEESRIFAQEMSRKLHALSPLVIREQALAAVNSSKREQSHTSRRLDVGMIDMSTHSDGENDETSEGEVGSIIRPEAHINARKLSRSRSRQSSRVTEAKLKEVHRRKGFKSGSFPPQGSLILGEQGELAAQPQSIDPRMLTVHQESQPQVNSNVEIEMQVDFATYIDQTSHHPSASQSRREHLGRGNAKPLFPPHLAAVPRQSTILPRRVDSSPSNRALRLASKRLVVGSLRAVNNRPSHQSAKPAQILAPKSSAKRNLEHTEPLPPPAEKADLESTKGATSKMPAATEAMSEVLLPNKTQNLKRPQKSQQSMAHPMDWDVGDVADESTALPTAKKPKLANATAKQEVRKSQARDRADEDSIQLDDSGVSAMLKRPKAKDKKGRKSQQIEPAAKVDEYEIETDEETTAPASKTKTSKATIKRVSNAANKKTKSQPPKATNTAPTKPAAKARKSLQPRNTNTTSLATTRARREPPKSKKYIEDLDSDVDLEEPSGDAEDVPQNTMKTIMSRKNNQAEESDNQDAIKSKSRLREGDEVTAKAMDKMHSKEVRPYHDASTDLLHSAPYVAKEPEATTAHETLVTASSIHLRQAGPQHADDENNGTPGLMSKGKNKADLQQRKSDAGVDDSEDETAQDSYPIATTKHQGPRVSFGSKLGQAVKMGAMQPKGPGTVAADAIPLLNAKSFVGSVNKTRSASPKKKRSPTNIAKKSKAEVAELPPRVVQSKKVGKKAVDDNNTTRVIPMEKQAAAPSIKNVNITTKISNGDPGTRKDEQTELSAKVGEAGGPQELRNKQQTIVTTRSTESREAASSRTRLVQQQRTTVDKAVSKQEDVTNIHEDDQKIKTLQTIEPEKPNVAIDLTQDSDDAVFGNEPNQLGYPQEDLTDVNNQVAAAPNTPGLPDRDNDETPTDLEDEPAIRQSARRTQANLQTPEHRTFARNPQSTEASAAVTSLRRNGLSAPKTLILTNAAKKKAQRLQFGKRVLQNQGIPSPDKRNHKSVTRATAPLEAQKHQEHEQRYSLVAVPNSFTNAPTLQADYQNAADAGDLDDQGILPEDDADAKGVDESAAYRRILSSEERVPVLARHLPNETVTISSSASQSSRVDQNGSPRLQPQLLAYPTDFAVSGMDVVPDVDNYQNSLEEEDIDESTEESASAESASPESDPSFHLTHEARVPVRSERSIRPRTHAATAVTSSPKTTNHAQRTRPAAAMEVKKAPRESLGLGKIVQEQYPQAQKDVNTSTFRKPALKTTMSKTLDVLPTLPVPMHKNPFKPAATGRQPLKELHRNNKVRVVDPKSSPGRGTDLSSTAPIRVLKPYPKTPLGPQPASDATNSTPSSLRTALLANQSERNNDKEETILENLDRGKSTRRHAEDADRTLVEGDSEHQHRRRHPSEASSVSSVSPQQDEEHGKTSREKELWRSGSREAQASVRDILMEITNNVLFRLESEEKAIELKISEYESGSTNILAKFNDTSKELFHHTGVAVLKKAAAKISKLNTLFDTLQDKKVLVRGTDTKDFVQRAIKLREDSFGERIQLMLEMERLGTVEGGQQAPLRSLPRNSAKPSKSTPKKSGARTLQTESLFPASKKDKRVIKHAHLISKISKPMSTKPRRRRPNKKLITTLDALASALPDNDELGIPNARDHVNIIKRKSMKSRPGALKRREKLDKGERDRFTKNMAQMATTNSNSQAAGTTDKWVALREFISQTLEKRPDIQS